MYRLLRLTVRLPFQSMLFLFSAWSATRGGVSVPGAHIVGDALMEAIKHLDAADHAMLRAFVKHGEKNMGARPSEN